MATFATTMVIEAGIDAYRHSQFRDAELMFRQVVDAEPFHWRARLMLGACLLKVGDAFGATTQFSFLRSNSTDADVRDRAQRALQAMNGNVDIMPQFTAIRLQD
jgi:hypothetical protein